MKNTIPDIVRGEDRSIKIQFSTAPTVGEQAGQYRLGISVDRGGADLLSINFGPSEYDSGTSAWYVTLTAAQTLALPIGDVYFDVWNRATGERKALGSNAVSVGVLAGTPT